jgi:hypothetical protein
MIRGAMISIAEQRLSRFLRLVLADLPGGAAIANSKQFGEVLSGLEWFLPEVLIEVYPEWEWECLDGVQSIWARKTGAGEAELLGLCVLMSDYTVTPVHVRLQVALSDDAISWLECRLGEKGQDGLVREPFNSSVIMSKHLWALQWRPDRIDWAYKATFGDRRQ